MKLTLCSDPFAVRAALRDMRNALAEHDLSANDLSRVEIVMAEILNNVVEHACAEHPDCRIDIEVVRGQADLQIKIIDDGRAMPGGKLPASEPTELPCNMNHLPEGGFGWTLIRDLARDVIYERRGHRNHLSLAIDLQGVSAA